MSHNLLVKLATSGIRNNKKAVLPYVIVSAITVMIFHILLSMVDSKFIMQDRRAVFRGAGYIVMFLQMASVVVAIFAVIFLFYGNQFVMKSRKKEIGLYGVLGLSKKNITIVMLIESFIMAGISIGLGVIAGCFFNKLMILLLYKLIHQPMVSGLEFSVKATGITIVLFAGIYLFCLIYNVTSVRLGNPISLLKSEHLGEKEPKIKMVLVILGILTLAAGYYLALSAGNTFRALGSLFKAIILVTIATYVLFMAGTIFVLKVLKKKKSYYYRTKNFISVSNLMFRMKHNAAGLASICILSTAVILLMACSSSLVMLGEQNINSMFQRDVMVWTNHTDNLTEEDAITMMVASLKEAGVNAEEGIYRNYQEQMCMTSEGGLEPLEKNSFDFTRMKLLYVLTLEDYNRIESANETLGEDEILCYGGEKSQKAGTNLSIYGKQYKIQKAIKSDCLRAAFDPTMALFEKVIVVVKDEEAMEAIITANESAEEMGSSNRGFCAVNIKEKMSDEQWNAVKSRLQNRFEGTSVVYKEEERQTFYGLYGGVFFVGVMLSGLFLVATVMIIFYKQMSEGMEDRNRFEILANAGLSETEAKEVIRNQVRIMFFLPVGTAILHMLVASKILRLFLSMILLVDAGTFIAAIVGVSFIFFVVYLLVYRITSKQYYQLVYGGK